jgi:diguanylate cyclase (GGDEF)-like protein
VIAIVIGAALAVVLVAAAALLVLAASRRANRRADERVSAAVAELNERMEALVRELGGALERAEADGRRSRVLGELAGSLDLDDVLERVLEAAARVASADAAIVHLAEGLEGRPTIVSLGLSTAEAGRQGAIARPPDGRTARSVSIAYRYDDEELEADGGLVHSGVAVPLVLDGAPIGELAAFSRSPGRDFADAEVRELEELGRRAAPAIENARRFREARDRADLDGLTGLHNRRSFHETLARECARARRYDRSLALLVLDVDDFKATNDRIGHLAGDGVLAAAAARLREATRSADVACRVGGDEFAIVLPEATTADAEQLYLRVQRGLSAAPAGAEGPLSLSAGIAQLAAGDDASSLFERADAALYRAKERGKAQVIAASS